MTTPISDMLRSLSALAAPLALAALLAPRRRARRP